jgi:hypothetical protein
VARIQNTGKIDTLTRLKNTEKIDRATRIQNTGKRDKMSRIQNTGKTYKMQLHGYEGFKIYLQIWHKISREILRENVKNIA